ncbi:MAG: IS30 family transposase [Porticoccaceae bacterium]|jgi:IS30 family transposase
MGEFLGQDFNLLDKLPVTAYDLTLNFFGAIEEVVSQAIIRILKQHKDKVKTLTFDNGSEFVRHEKIAKSLNAKTYFAHPYSSWERGINENTNGLLRQYFPKKTDFRQVSWKQVKDAVESLNNRPRKTRGYKTPNQLFNDTFVPLT